MIRARLERLRSRKGQHGYTLVEVVATVVILGIIMVPLGTAMVVGFRTVFGIQERLANSADVQRLSTYFPSDVASVDSDGVNPARVEDQGICKANATEQSLITFRWDKDLGENGQTVVRYLARGSGSNSEVVRRICRGSAAPVETVLANHFGEAGGPEASSYLVDPDHTDLPPTPICGTRLCYIDIHGAYDFHLDAQRRVEGDSGTNKPPGAPTNVHALGGYQRARLFWTDPVDTGGLPITGYYVEQTPGGIVGGANPVLYPAGSGNPPGALIGGLTNFQSYTFRVRAVTIIGNGPWSAPSPAVTPGPTTPEPPTLDSAAGDAATNGVINGSWSLSADYSDGGSPITGFRLTATDPSSTPTVVTFNNPAARTGAVSGLVDNTRYTVQVTALNSYGEGSSSQSISGLTLPGKPGTPTAAGSGTAGTVILTFTPPTSGVFADFTNFRAKVGAAFSAPVAAATACPTSASCSLTVTGVNVNSATVVNVQAQNATGWGTLSDPLTIPADTTPPTVAITTPANAGQYGSGTWNAACSNAGGAVCGTAADGPPGGVASVTVTIRRSSDNRYWNGSAGTSTTQWSSASPISLTATGTTSWSRALTTASLQTGVTYTVTAVAKDTVNLSSTTATSTFTYLTGAPTTAFTAPASGAKVHGAVTISGTASATSPATVASVEFQYSPAGAGTWTSIAIDVATPYTTSWDTTAVADGSYDLQMIVTDSAGNTNSAVRTITVDNTAPTGNITAPTDGDYVHGNAVTVSSNSADAGSGVANATFQFKPTAGVTWTTIGAPDATSPYSVSWNTTTLTDGSYDLQVITTDNAGNTFTSLVISVLVDNTAPTIGAPNVVGTLGANGWYTSNVTVTWPAPTDAGSGIASTTGCGTTNITVNTAGQVVTCSATDNAGNTASQSVTIKVDKNAPTGSLTAPANGASVTGSVTVSSDSADTGGSGVANATFQSSPAGANTWTTIGAPDTTSPYSVSWNTAVLANGSYDLRVVTTDNAGLTFTSATRTVTVDATAPTVTITFPANAGQYNAAGYAAGCVTNNVCGTASDVGTGVSTVTLTIQRSSDNRYWNGTAGTTTTQWLTTPTNLAATGTTTWNRVFTTASLSTNVSYTIVATATDGVGLTGTDSNVFVYDTTAPTGSITAPSAGANVKGNAVTISSNSADTAPGTVASAVFQRSPIGANTWTTIATDTVSPYTNAWDTTLLTDGQYDLRVITTDAAGNTFTSATVTVRVDNTLPTGSITAPSAGANVKGTTVAVSSNSADGGSGVANATFQRSPIGANTWTQIGAADATSPYSVTWDTTAVADGQYDLRVLTTDNAGNVFTSPIVTVRVDNTGPTIGAPIVVGTLGANGWYTSNVTVNWPAPTDSGSGIASTTGCGTTNITTDQTGQVVTCSATDNAGNTSSNSVTIKRDATAPTGSLTAPANGAVVAGTGSVTVSSDSADVTSGVANATFQSSPAGANTWTTIGAADTTSPYSVSWNVVPLADGSYDLRVVTTDNAGLTFTSAIRTVYVDKTAPTMTITKPVDGGAYNAAGWATGCATNDVCGTAADAAPGSVSTVTITIQRSSDNRYWNGTAGTTTTQWLTTPTNLALNGTTAWNRVFTTASLSTNVTYTVVGTATDSVGLTGTDTAVFVYDTTAPTGSITAPSAGANVKGNAVTVSSNSADTAPGTVASVAFQRSPIGAGTWTTIATDTVTPYTTAWDTTVLTDGQYDLRVVTTDAAGNTFTSATVTVRVDNTLPTGSITAPSAGANVKGTTVAVSSSSADTGGSGVLNATFQRSPIGANTWTQIGAADTTSPYSVTWDTTAVADGQYDLRVLTTDNAGNVFTSAIVTVRVDNTVPSITPNVAGTLGTNGWYTSNVDVTWTVTDNGSGIASTTGCGTTSITTNQAGQLVTCSATDNAGNTTSQSVTIKRDATAPTGSLTAPANGATVASTVTVSSDSADVISGVANATFQSSPAGAGTWSTIGAADTTSPYSVSWDTSVLTQGSYDLRVVTTDNAGLTFTSATRTVFVDSVPPTVTIVKPIDGGAYNAAGWATGCATNDICGTASDTAPGTVSSVTVTIRRSSDSRYWNGTAGTTTTQWLTTPTNLTVNGTTAWNRVFTTASLSTNVTYTVVATATDSSALTGTDTAVFVYDTTNPTGSLTAPSAAANVRGNAVTVSSNSADTAPGTVASATFQRSPIGAGTWTTIGAPDTTSPYQVAWDTTAVADGQYDLRVVTTDAAGNTFTSATVTVRVDNTLPTGSLTAPNAGAIVKGAAVAVSSSSADGGSGVLNADFQRSPSGANTWTSIATDTTTPYSVTWNTTTLTDGAYDLRVVTTDNAGNQFTSPIRTVTVDNIGPTITGNATGTVGSNGWYTTNVGLTWTVTDSPGSGVATTTNCGPQNVVADTTSTGVSFTCSATDNAGNTSNGTVTIKRDATNPTGSITAPTAGTSVRGNAVAVTSNSADAASGVANATYQRSPAGLNSWTTIGAPDTTSPYSVTWDTTAVTDGNYDLRVITTDNAGLTFTSPTATVEVDNTKPVPTNVALVNNGGAGGLGKVAAGDAITITYSEPLAVASLCTGWTPNGSNQTISTVTVTMSTSDALTFGGPCANIGSVQTSGNYNSNVIFTLTFTNSTVAWNATTNTLTVTLGAVGGSGTVNTGVPAAKPTYTPTTSIQDEVGNSMNATLFTAPANSQF
ncbi:MAG: Ig-like domain-containing protein [Acidimicrobiia bacterium]